MHFIFFLLIFIFSSAAIEIFHIGLGWHDQQRIYQLILLTVSSILFYFIRPTILPRVAFSALLVIFFLGAVSVTLAKYPFWAQKELARYIGLLLLTLAIADLARQRCLMRGIFFLLAVTAFLNAFQFIVYYFMAFATNIFMFNADLLFSGFSNPRFLNQFQVLFMPILAYLAIYHWLAKRKYSRLLAAISFGTLIIHWCTAFTLGGRGLWLGLAVSNSALIFLFLRFWRLLIVQATAGILGFALYYLMFFMTLEWLGLESSVRDSLRFGLSKREVIWKVAWDLFIAHPWLGVGPMHFSATVNSIAAHPHQVILQWLAEWGLFATLGALFIATWGMIHGLRFIRSNAGQPLDATLWMSILGALALAQVDGVFAMPYTETWLAILIGLAIARWAQPSAESQWQTYALRLLALPVILILGNVLINEVPTLSQDSEAHMGKHGTGYTPRFWMQGWIPMDGK